MQAKKVFIMGNGTIVENDYKKGTIIGNAEIYGGRFDKLRVIGNSEITGPVEAVRLTVIGNLEAAEPVAADFVRLTAHSSFVKLDARHIFIRWGDRNTDVFSLKGKISADLLEVSAKCSLDGCNNIKNYLISGYLQALQEINCDSFICMGTAIAPSINASEIHLYPCAGSDIKELVGTRIFITSSFEKAELSIPSSFSINKHMRKAHKHIRKAHSDKTRLKLDNIEADEIYLEDTDAAHVSGKNVNIGPNCNIGHLEYMETVKTAPGSSIGKLEKI